MGQVNLVEVVTKVVGLISKLTVEERKRVLDAAATIIGDPPYTKPSSVAATNSSASSTPHRADSMTADDYDLKDPKEFFSKKDPQSKIESLVVAARYREIHEKKDQHEKADFAKVFSDARRNFDAHNFAADLRNARALGYFNKSSHGVAVLSHYGQNYADALPDKEKKQALSRPKHPSAKKKAPSKAIAKK